MRILQCIITKTDLSGDHTYAQNYAYALQQGQQQSRTPFSGAALLESLLSRVLAHCRCKFLGHPVKEVENTYQPCMSVESEKYLLKNQLNTFVLHKKILCRFPVSIRILK